MKCDRITTTLPMRRCARTRGHTGECRTVADVLGAPLSDAELAKLKRVVDERERGPILPIGCIHTDALDSLASTMARLERYHFESGGKHDERPCLRRLESANGVITAHISSGPPVGGTWVRLELDRGKWMVRDA